MILGMFQKAPVASVPHEIYGAVMAQARRPGFYSGLGIPDTAIGRLEILVLHLVLLANRLSAEAGEKARLLNQEIFDVFTRDMDRTLREIGIGDTSVPKRKKKLVHSYYGQLDLLVPPLDAGDEEELCRRVDARFYEGEEPEKARQLAGYAAAAHAALARLSLDDILHVRLIWPPVPTGQGEGGSS